MSILALSLVMVAALLHALWNGDLTVVYPMARGTGPLLSSLGAMVLLAERPSLFTLAGLAAG